MTASAPACVTASVSIAAAPAAVYALITDLPTLASLAEEAHAMQWKKGDAATPGAVFVGQNRNGSRTWTTTCTVTAADPGRTFAFDVKSLMFPVAHWRYDIAATDTGCTVTESTWDQRAGWFKFVGGLATGVTDRDSTNTEHIKRTLERLKARAER
ncbi:MULTISPECIES: SRPBCC family protein [unclassified Mycolicibacterium]|uniref:SRPBCC family protein n=1 Tax=unclassified Mycolicibacterium TaxID=2636767 RepID=UPI002EDA9952